MSFSSQIFWQIIHLNNLSWATHHLFFHCHEHTRELSKKKHNLFLCCCRFCSCFIFISCHHHTSYTIRAAAAQAQLPIRNQAKPLLKLSCLLTYSTQLFNRLIGLERYDDVVENEERDREMLRWRTKKSWVFRGWAFSPFSSFVREATLLLHFWCSCAAVFIFM